VLESGEPFTGEAFPFAYMVDGKPHTSHWDFTYQPVCGDDGGIEGIMVLASEVSSVVERERLQATHIAQLKASERIKDEFLSVISHELRTPLNFIMGFASTLEDEVYGPLNEGQLTAVSRILNGADRMVVLVDDLLDYAKLQAGKFDLTPVPTPYGPLVADALALMQPLADQRGLQLTHDIDVPGVPTLDAGRITQVLTNLVSNALKFADAGSQVAIRACLQEGQLRTEVSDTGCGIHPDDIPRLFQRFQQLDMSSTRRAGGTGLGLAITKAIVEAHGGAIGVTSELEKGSTFWFTLPQTSLFPPSAPE
jgi:signal transduction histidine kinase